jgi:hypothetical protein
MSDWPVMIRTVPLNTKRLIILIKWKNHLPLFLITHFKLEIDYFEASPHNGPIIYLRSLSGLLL